MEQNQKINVYAYSRLGDSNNFNRDNVYINGKNIVEDERYCNFEFDAESDEYIQVYAVCNGIGEGEHAAIPPLAVTQLLSLLQKRLNEDNNDGQELDEINKFITDTNNKIQLYKGSVEKDEIGTTFAAVFIFGDRAFTVHSGDSRVYLYSKSGLAQLTNDHIEAEALVELGILNKEQALIHRAKSKVTKYFGIDDNNADTIAEISDVFTIVKDDIIILTTDGITDNMEFNEIRDSSKAFARDESILANDLIQKTSHRNTTDDSTIIVAKVNEVVKSHNFERKWQMFDNKDVKKLSVIIAGITAVTLLLFVIMALVSKPEGDVLPSDIVVKKQYLEPAKFLSSNISKITYDYNSKVQEKVAEMNLEVEKEKQEEKASDNQQNSDDNNTLEVDAEYVVQKNDNLYKISKKFYGRSEIDKILMANNLKDKNKLFVGQVLKIPKQVYDSETDTYIIPIDYKIAQGDTLYGISMKMYGNGKKVEQIKALNNMSDEDKLISGKIIKLP